MPTMVRVVKATVFPVVMHGCESWTIKKAERQRIDAFKLWCWRRLLRVLWTAMRSTQSILKESSLNIHWKGWCWSWSSNNLATWCEERTHWKTPWYWERLKAGEEGDDRGWDRWWHHRLNGHEFEKAAGVGDGQGGLACCSLWGHKELNTTERLSWTELRQGQISALHPSPISRTQWAECCLLTSVPGPGLRDVSVGPDMKHPGDGWAGGMEFYKILGLYVYTYVCIFQIQ